jgi:hypothetical protein
MSKKPVKEKKEKYKEVSTKNKFVVSADYQPAYMDSPPDIRVSYHETCNSVGDKLKEHKKNGASGISVMQIIIRFEVNR